MDLSEHLALTLPAAAAVALASGQVEAGIGFAVGGILVDLDHMPDYWRERGHTLSLESLNAHFGDRHAWHLLLPLHGWELNGVLWSAWAGLGLPLWVAAFAAGWLAHLALDQRYNLLKPWAYWLFGRYQIGFHAEELFLHPKA